MALSRNQPPGPMAGKAGLASERDFVAEWSHEESCFVLLHDLTSCLRIGDATLFKSVGAEFEAYLYEIKLGILQTLASEDKPTFAGDIACELDVSPQLVDWRGRRLAERDLITRQSVKVKRQFETTKLARNIYFSDPDTGSLHVDE